MQQVTGDVLIEAGDEGEQVAIAESDTPANLRMTIQNKKASERTTDVSMRDNLTPRKPSDF